MPLNRRQQTTQVSFQIMKIQLVSTLPFTPVQLDSRHIEPRRAVGQLHGSIDVGNKGSDDGSGGASEGARDYVLPVYEFRHNSDDTIDYQVNLSERAFINGEHELSLNAANDQDVNGGQTLQWVRHVDGLSYKPYAFLVMDAMKNLLGDWDGVLYRTPRGERLRESAFQATLEVMDACVCSKHGLWVMVSLTGEQSSVVTSSPAMHQLGWVPVAV